MNTEQKDFSKHRFLGKIQELYGSGRRSFFFHQSDVYRERYYDSYLYSLEKGIFKTKDNLKNYCLEELNFEGFFAIEKGTESSEHILYTLYLADGTEIKDNTEQFNNFLFPEKQKDENDPLAGATVDDTPPSNEQGQETNPEEEATQNANTTSGFLNFTHKIIEESARHVAVYIESLDPIAKIFGNEPETEVIERLKYWETIEKTDKLLFMGLEKIDFYLEQYTINLEEKDNFLKIGFPNSYEIFNSLLRIIACDNREFHFENDHFLVELARLAETEERLLKDIIAYFDENWGTLQEKGLCFFEEHFVSEQNKREKVSFDDIIMDQGTKADIREKVVAFLEENENASRGMILYGPPGTGKTSIAKAVASEYRCAFKAINISDLKKGYVGQSGQAVKELYDELEQRQPVILFIDEIDGLFTRRNSQHGDSFTDDIVNAMLSRIDGVGSAKKKIFLIGATNNLQTLDTAIISRFDAIEIGLPKPEQRKEILEKNLRKRGFSVDFENFPEADYDHIISDTLEGFSGRDIENICKEIRRRTPTNLLTQKLFEESLERFESLSLHELQEDFPSLLYSKEKNSDALKDIHASEKSKQTLIEHFKILDYDIETYDQFKDKIGVENGILLYGPPGNGKSFFMEQFAKQNDLYFVKILAKDIQHPGKVQSLFKRVDNICQISKTKKGALLFFDEIDGLLSGGQNSEIRSNFLDCLSDKQYRERQNFFIGAATNFKSQLDAAAIRKGRFDLHLYLGGVESCESFKNILTSFIQQDGFLFKQGVSLDREVSFKNLYKTIKQKKERNPEIPHHPEMEDRTVAISDIKDFLRILKKRCFDSSQKIITQNDIDELEKEG